jgi:hypothetical protein
MIKATGANYNKNMLNPASNEAKYTSIIQKAMNLGVYGADLSYASIFDQKQESMNYLAAAQKLARQMGVDGALQDDMIERLNTNQDNRDSLIKIVTEAYTDLNGYLKENNRIEVSALVVAGGWMEALYLSTRYSAIKDPALKTRIAEQKLSLEQLIKYFDKFGEKESLKEMKADLMAMKAVFDEVQMSDGKTTSSKNADGSFVIGNNSSTTMSDETLKKIETLVAQLRSKYIA